jgi:hypothetical protein
VETERSDESNCSICEPQALLYLAYIKFKASKVSYILPLQCSVILPSFVEILIMSLTFLFSELS